MQQLPSAFREFPSTAPRLCRVRSEESTDQDPFPLDEAGFLDPPSSTPSSIGAPGPSGYVPPITAAEFGALVLLGEPGVGKTTAFQQISQHWQETNTQRLKIVHVDGVRLTDASFPRLITSHLELLPSRDADEDLELVIIIDQLDESPMLRAVAAELDGVLAQTNTRGLRVLIACRTADYPNSLTNVLRKHFSACTLADLAPLTRDQARNLVQSAGIDGDHFISEVVASLAGGLASVPLTLKLLTANYHRTGTFHSGPTALFEQSVRVLLDEPDDERRHLATSIEQMLAVSKRIAARLLLTGRRNIWIGNDLDANPTDLKSGGLTGGFEVTPNGQFEVTSEIVTTVLQSALFAGRGEKRQGFIHSTIASYLAASYLHDRSVPPAQLKPLFLVAGDNRTTSIPAPLRESASWLAAIAPEHADWLVEADARSLSGHTPLITSDLTRSMIVRSLLHHAPENELSRDRAVPHGIKLDHDQLWKTIQPVFERIPDVDPNDWDNQSRVRVALRILQEARAPELLQHLISLAADDRWNAHIRRMAVVAAMHSGGAAAAEPLLSILSGIADPVYAALVDPDDELRGGLLSELWPAYLPTADMLGYLRKRQNLGFFGAYALFTYEAAQKVPLDDIPALVAWAMHLPDEPETEEDHAGGVKGDLSLRIIERVLGADDDVSEQLETIAPLIAAALQLQRDITLPDSLTSSQSEDKSNSARELKRDIALATLRSWLRIDPVDRFKCWRLIDGWEKTFSIWRTEGHQNRKTPLLDRQDFLWALTKSAEAASAGDQPFADALGKLASILFDPYDDSMVNSVYSDQDSSAWAELRHWFDPVDVAGPQAQELREIHRMSTDTRGSQFESELLIANQQHLLLEAEQGVTDSFWRLAWNLQIDPISGWGEERQEYDISRLPGTEALGSEALAPLQRAAQLFVSMENDHADEWLGSKKWDKRAWAGYLGLALLHKSNLLSSLTADDWRRWCGAILWFEAGAAYHQQHFREMKAKLLRLAATHAQEILASRLLQYVRGELSIGYLAWEVLHVEPTLGPDVTNALVILEQEIREALVQSYRDQLEETDGGPICAVGQGATVDEQVGLADPANRIRRDRQVWESIASKLLVRNDGQIRGILTDIVESFSGDESMTDPWLAVASGRLLIEKYPETSWECVRSLTANSDTREDFALALAQSNSIESVLTEVSEAVLTEIYQWLARLYGADRVEIKAGVHIVGPAERARDLRDKALRELTERATINAVGELAKLYESDPTSLSVRSSLVNARILLNAGLWKPPQPEELALLLQDATRRIARTSEELLDILLEAIDRIAVDIQNHGELLWDWSKARAASGSTKKSAPTEAWQPKPEAALSVYLAHELRLRLFDRKIVVNREVVVRSSNAQGAGNRTDILVESIASQERLGTAEKDRLAVVIEVKGSWNQHLLESQETQLVMRYLPEYGTNCGIYAVGWYPLSMWTANGDGRKTRARKLSLAPLREKLETQAALLSVKNDASVRAIMLEVPRPISNS